MELLKKYSEFYEEISKKSSEIGVAMYVKSVEMNGQCPSKCDSAV